MSHQLQTDKERRFYRLVTTLTHIQDLAYANEDRRTSQNILAMHNLTYIFFLDYKKVSNNECTHRKLIAIYTTVESCLIAEQGKIIVSKLDSNICQCSSF